MAGSLEDLNFAVNAHVRDAMDDLKKLGRQLDEILKTTDNVDSSFRAMGASIGLPAKQVELLLLRIQPLVNTLAKADKQAHALEESFTRKLMQKALEDHNRKVITLADGTQRARYEMIRLADASQQLRIPTQAPRAPAQQQASGGVNFVRITTAAAQMGMLARVSATMANVSKSVTSVTEVSKIAASSMDRFRMGLAAPKVNPEMNVIKSGIDKVGDAAANGINKVREIADAVASDIPGTVGSAVGAMGKVNVELDKTSATVSKHVSKMQSSSKGLTFLGKVFPFLKTQINSVQEPFDKLRSKAEQAANKLDQANAEVSATANKLRNARFVMDGTFQSLGGSADMFARAAFHANLPVRLLKREWEGATRVVRAATHVWNFATHPIHKATLAIGHARAQYNVFRSSLPQLTGGLQLGTRLFRAFAHATYFTGPAATLATKAITGVAKGLWALTSPARGATASIAKLTGVQNTFIGKALGMSKAGNDAAASLAKMDAASVKASKNVGAFGSKAGMMKTAAAGMLAGIVALGTSTAVASEKNAAIFGTMLHDMEQGAATVRSIQGTKAAKFFDNQELLDSGRLLYKANVSAADLAGKTDQFAKIAVGASVDIGMLADRYMQGFQQGSFGLGQINDMAREGVAIYSGLTAATGLSGDALQKMIADGKIGMKEMDAALASLTEGNGIYAGSLDAMATTTAGKMATIKNNVSQALGQVMGVALEMLAPFGTAIVMMSEQLSGAFTAFRGPIIYGATAVAWFFGNFVNIGKFALTSFALFFVSAFNDFAYFFTTKLPAYLGWFSNNWTQVFYDAANIVGTVFKNMAKNIWTVMKQVWAFIKSGGRSELSFAFVPLLDGFKKTVAEIPNIPERAMTQLEKNLTLQTQQIGGDLANNFDSMLAEAQAKVSAAAPVLSDKAGGGATGSETGSTAAASAARKAAENRAIGVRSAEGQSVIAQMSKIFGKNDKEKKAQDAQIQQAKDIKDIAREVRRGKPLIAKAF
jgi:tape measure domain-containing protein